MYNRRKKRALRLAMMTADEFVGNRSEATLDTRSHPVWDSGIVSRCKDMIEQMLNRHFKGQQDTFPYGRIERLLNALVQSESGQGQGHGISGKAVARFLHKLDPVLIGWTESGSAAVDALLTRALHTAAVDAFRAAFATWDERLGVDLRPTPEMMAGPSSWAERRAAELAALIQETTRNRIAGVIAKGLERGLSVRGIIGNIRHYLDGMAADRAETIARTEASNAVNRSVFDANRRLGATEKRWVSSRDPIVCEICRKNDGQGRIPMEEGYLSGHQRPPAHPRCRCIALYYGVTRESALQALGLMP